VTCGWEDMTPGQPCWGPVGVVDEDGSGEAVWACSGHAEMWEHGQYTVQGTGERVSPSFDEPEPPK
jgi:hypothetical protein